MVKNPPAMQETQVRSLGQKDPVEKGMTTHSSILAWRIPQTEEPGRFQSMGLQRVHGVALSYPIISTESGNISALFALDQASSMVSGIAGVL